MEIKRHENGISWQGKGQAGSIGIIKTTTNSKWDSKQYQRWVDYCAAEANPNPHSVSETIAWMQGQWDILPLDRQHEKVKAAYGSMVQTLCPEKLQHEPAGFTMDMTDSEIEHWLNETEARRLEAENVSESVSGLKMIGFQLPPTEINRADMESSIVEFIKTLPQDRKNMPKPEFSDCYLFFEETTPNLLSSGVGSTAIVQKITSYWGVAQEDIVKRSTRFIGYIHNKPDGLMSFDEFAELEGK